MIEKPTMIAEEFARDAGACCMTKESRSKADLGIIVDAGSCSLWAKERSKGALGGPS